jgi:hypothetical protein
VVVLETVVVECSAVAVECSAMSAKRRRVAITAGQIPQVVLGGGKQEDGKEDGGRGGCEGSGWEGVGGVEKSRTAVGVKCSRPDLASRSSRSSHPLNPPGL